MQHSIFSPASRRSCRRAASASVVIAPVALLAACASPAGDYPSLAIRDAERVSGSLPPPRAPYIAPEPAASVLADVQTLTVAAERAHQAFLAAAPSASATIERAGRAGVGSDGWAHAEVALADLVSIRSRIMEPLADLDRLYVDAAVEGRALTTIGAARSAVEAQLAEEDAAIDRLQQVLAQ